MAWPFRTYPPDFSYKAPYCLDFTATGKINDDALVFALAKDDG